MGRRDEGRRGEPVGTKDPVLDPSTGTTYVAGTYVDPDGDGQYQLVGADGETLGTDKFWDQGKTPVLKGQTKAP